MLKLYVYLSVLGVAGNLVAGTIGVTGATPSSVPAGVATQVTFTAIITDTSLIAGSVNLLSVDSQGRSTVIGTMTDDGLNGDAIANDKQFSYRFSIFQQNAGTLTYRVSAGFRGSLTRTLSANISVNATGTGGGITISTPTVGGYLNISPTLVRGTVSDPNAAVVINGISAQVANGQFSASVPLLEGTNTLTAVAYNTNGSTGTGSRIITLDTTPPRVTIDTPGNATTTTAASVNVTGIVNDLVVGTVNPLQATVTVNGIAATVTNRTYLAQSVALAMGANTLTARARDRAGNFATTSVTITRVAVTQPSLQIVSGNNLSGSIRSLLAAPLVVQAVDGSGHPITNRPVVFRVINGDGTLTPVGAPGIPSIAVNTNSQGQAQVRCILGSRAGAGNNQIEASASGVVNTVVFTESATTTAAAKILIDSGNNQNGVVGQALPLPFIAIVTDAGNNRLADVPVVFTVKNGGGTINGLGSLSTTSDSDGRVQAILTTGPFEGVNNNVVEANFAGNTGQPATFASTGQIPGPAAQTQITGVVLDNSNLPIPGVSMRVFQVNNGTTGNIPQQVVATVRTDAHGYFNIQPAPVGVFKLMADGSTASRPGPFPTLEYDIVTVSGRNNNVGLPIFLPQLSAASQLCVSPTTGGTLTIPQAPGFALTIAPGSATFPGGSRTGCVSVTPVNMDKVPMVPGFGQQPRFIVTIQPVGTTFNPPAAITIPNVDGLAPRAVTELYSYDHDLASFVAIGTGRVSADGSVIASDPGVGVIKAGWHCGGDPNQSGTAGTCPICQTCQGNDCVVDDSQHPPGNCKVCKNGAVAEVDLGSWTDDLTVGASASLPEPLKNALQNGINSIPGVNITVSEVKLGVQGKAKDCCDPASGNPVRLGKKEGSANIQAKIPAINVQIFPLPPTMIDRRWSVTVFGEIVEVRILFLAGVFIRSELAFGAEGGVRIDACGDENCIFGGLTADLSVGLVVEASAQGCFDSTLTQQYCSPTIDVSFAPITLTFQGRAGYNQAKCGTGISGFVKLANIKLSLEFKLPLLPTLSAEYEIYGGRCLIGNCGT